MVAWRGRLLLHPVLSSNFYENNNRENWTEAVIIHPQAVDRRLYVYKYSDHEILLTRFPTYLHTYGLMVQSKAECLIGSAIISFGFEISVRIDTGPQSQLFISYFLPLMN